MKKNILISMLLSLFMVNVICCNPIKGEWEKVKKINTVEAYKEFIDKYPKSEFYNEAKKKIAGIEWNKVGEGSILITNGFEYRTNYKFNNEKTIIIEKIDNLGVFRVKDGMSFIPLCIESENSKKEREERRKSGGFYFDVMADAIGNKWVFPYKDMKFAIVAGKSLFILRSLVNDASVKFREDGVLVTGFEIKPD